MPLYEYKCRDCAHLFEKIQNFRSRAPKCPECGGRTDKQLSAPAIRFKGTGFYITDYARKGEGGDKGDKAEKAEKTGKADKPAKTDKPAAKAAKKTGGD